MSETPYIGFLKFLVVLPLMAYLGLVFFALLFANKFVFPAPASGYRDSPDLIKFPYNDRNDEVTLLFIENPDSPYLVFYHHGNGEDLEGILPRLKTLRQMGFSVLAWDYPGYGTSDGKPSEKLIFNIADQIWNKIPESFNFQHERVIHYGRSVGGGPATYLASRNKSAGLIMEGSFTSIFRVALPVRMLPWDIFDNLSRIGKIQCPVLFIHGTDDKTVPFSHSQKLLDKAPQPKFFSWYSGGGHNDLIEKYSETYYSSIFRFRDFLLTGNQ